MGKKTDSKKKSKGRKPSKKRNSSKKKKNLKSKKALVVEPEVLEPPSKPPSQGQFICVHIGQAGIQVGSACWELFCLEHGINSDGSISQLSTNSNSTSLFSLSQANTYVPRALLVDTESSAIDVIKNGNYQKLFAPQSMIHGKENASSNHAAGFYGVGKKLTITFMDRLTHLAEDCDSLQGIALFRSIGGGTGSGMGSRIIDNIKNTFPNRTVLDFNVYSSKIAPVIVEPYNVALTSHHVLNMVNCSFLFDNRSLYDICKSKLDLCSTNYKHINNIIALVLSGITSSLRFEGSMMRNISELLTDLIPHPRLHFPLITHVPISNSLSNISTSTTQLTAMSFDQSYQMTKIDPRLGKYLSICTMFRGDLKPTEINTSIAFIQREHTLPVTQNMNSPLFKFGLCYKHPITAPQSGIVAAAKAVTTLCNNTAVKHHWMSIMENYNMLLKKRAFLHHYTKEGMEEMEFHAAKENISKLIEEYEKIESS